MYIILHDNIYMNISNFTIIITSIVLIIIISITIYIGQCRFRESFVAPTQRPRTRVTRAPSSVTTRAPTQREQPTIVTVASSGDATSPPLARDSLPVTTIAQDQNTVFALTQTATGQEFSKIGTRAPVVDIAKQSTIIKAPSRVITTRAPVVKPTKPPKTTKQPKTTKPPKTTKQPVVKMARLITTTLTPTLSETEEPVITTRPPSLISRIETRAPLVYTTTTTKLPAITSSPISTDDTASTSDTTNPPTLPPTTMPQVTRTSIARRAAPVRLR
jgi:hypothetical protein